MSGSHFLTIITHGETKKIETFPGKTILDLLKEADVSFSAPCAGNGTCGKCRVKAEGVLSTLTKQEEEVLSDEELVEGIRLACQTKPKGDVTIFLQGDDKGVIQTEGGLMKPRLNPSVRVVPFTPAKADIHHQESMVKSVCNALLFNGVQVDVVESSCLMKIASVMEQANGGPMVAVLDDNRLMDIVIGEKPVLGVAVDIGTTTVAAYLYNLLNGERVGVKSELSAQRTFGADVISRIKSANEDGLEPLRSAIVDQLNRLIGALCKECGTQCVMKMTVCGNPTMQHILCNLPPRTIAVAPFTTVSDFGITIKASEIGIHLNENANVYVFPAISGYVGGDITAGIIACGMEKGESIRLLIDIGTNGEMALATQNGIYYCATAAGPAFEGAHIEDGVGGIFGAISAAKVVDGIVEIRTIADKPVVGICGSGIIDAIAVMLDVGAVDETGRLCDTDEYEAPFNQMLDEENSKFIFDTTSAVGITAKDVREVQLAKAAIAAGIQSLIHHSGIREEDIAHVYLAGGFGSHISKESSCRIGLLPCSMLDRIIPVGNSAGMGAIMALLDKSVATVVGELPEKGHYIELSTYPFFNDAYIDNMMF